MGPGWFRMDCMSIQYKKYIQILFCTFFISMTVSADECCSVLEEAQKEEIVSGVQKDASLEDIDDLSHTETLSKAIGEEDTITKDAKKKERPVFEKIIKIADIPNIKSRMVKENKNKTSDTKHDYSIAGAIGASAMGKMKRYGHNVSHKLRLIGKVEVLKKVSETLSFGMSIIHQNSSRSEDGYTIGKITTNKAQIDYQATAMLANVKFISPGKKLSPYFTASGGATLNKLKNEVHSNPDLSASHKGKLHIQPAFALGLGFYYSLSERSRMFFEYQYLDSGKLKSDTSIDTFGVSTEDDVQRSLRNHILMIGMDVKL